MVQATPKGGPEFYSGTQTPRDQPKEEHLKIKIAARAFTVSPMTKTEFDTGDCVGFTQPNVGKIGIYPGIPPDHQAETLLHELIHAAWYAYGLPAKATEEQVAQGLGAAFAQILRDNPLLIGKVVAAQQGEPVVKEEP